MEYKITFTDRPTLKVAQASRRQQRPGGYVFDAERGHSCPQQRVWFQNADKTGRNGRSGAAADRNVRAPLNRYPGGIPGKLAGETPALRKRGSAAFTVMEVMVASGLGLLVLALVGSLSFYSSRSFVAIANYVDMDQHSQFALDKMSRELRQAHIVTGFSSNTISFLDADRNPVKFVYDSNARTLVRQSGDTTTTNLTNCDSLRFSNYQGTIRSNTFDAYDPAYVKDTRLIQVTWVCSRKILGTKANTESVQSAKIAIRNHS